MSFKILIDKSEATPKLKELLGSPRESLNRDGQRVALKGDSMDQADAEQILSDYVADKEALDASFILDIKLDKLRSMRDTLWDEIKVELNKHADNHPATIATEALWRSYRNQLRDITEQYKQHKTDAAQASALDALDLESEIMPTKPS